MARGWRCESRRAAILAAATLAVATPAPPPSPPPSPPPCLPPSPSPRRRLLDCHPRHATPCPRCRLRRHYPPVTHAIDMLSPAPPHCCHPRYRPPPRRPRRRLARHTHAATTPTPLLPPTLPSPIPLLSPLRIAHTRRCHPHRCHPCRCPRQSIATHAVDALGRPASGLREGVEDVECRAL